MLQVDSKTMTDHTGLTTTYTYPNAGLVTNIQLLGIDSGFKHYLSRELCSKTGSSTVSEFYDYGTAGTGTISDWCQMPMGEVH